MRDLVEVIDKMVSIIPITEFQLLLDLQSAKSSASFSSPETMWVRWQQSAEVLWEHFGDDPKKWEEWKLSVIDIWQGSQEWRNKT